MNTLHFESIDSTNTFLKNNYQNLNDMTFVSADYQTQGKGRTNRKWISENGNNLLFSLLILDRELIQKYQDISIVTAYSIVQVLKDLGIKNASIKWPNDVYVNDSKIAGVLLEAITKNEIECLIVGVGINVNSTDFSFEYLHKPTSIHNELNKKINIDELKSALYQALLNNLNLIKSNYDFYNDIKTFDYLKNKEAYALIDNQKQFVSIIGINKDYSLKVKCNNTEYDLNSDEISFHL